jgi:hypothetical protein
MTDWVTAHRTRPMRRAVFLLIGCSVLAAPMQAQEPQVSSAAAALLQLRDSLALDSAQTRRLTELDRTQSAAMSRALATFLRAEADVIDALRSDDPIIRRTALEKRAKAAIDADLSRLKADKDARMVLRAPQLAHLGSISGGSRAAPIWQALIAPLNLAVPTPAAADSGEARISVTPNYADIFVNGEKRGTGRRFLTLPVGEHNLLLSAVGCEPKALRVTVAKSTPAIISQVLTCTR